MMECCKEIALFAIFLALACIVALTEVIELKRRIKKLEPPNQ
jgi:hypothetical protein